MSWVVADGDDVHDAELDGADAEAAEGGEAAVLHCACAFCITLLLSSRNIKDN